MIKETVLSYLELSRSALKHNYSYFRSFLKDSTKLLVLVKSNAYGHGAVEVASILQEEGVDYLAVALTTEGIELREGGITLPIIVLVTGTEAFSDIIEYNLEPGIPDLHTLSALCEELKSRGIEDFPVHIKLDTGMHRLGFMANELPELLDFLKHHSEVRVKSIYSHLSASSDPAEDAFTLAQIEKFEHETTALSESLGYMPMRHILNSAGILRFSKYQYDMVRLGVGIYGISALEDVKLKPVATLKAKVVQVKKLNPEDGPVGYNLKGIVKKEGTEVAVIPLGYADGIDRRLGMGAATFSVKGKRAPTLGIICMDMCMLDVTGLGVKPGDEVTIFGEDPTVTELAGILETIPYEIFVSMRKKRVRKIVE